MFLVNHWSEQREAARGHRRDAGQRLRRAVPRAHQCEKERGLLPNYIAVDFYDQGDLLQVVDQLNGFD